MPRKTKPVTIATEYLDGAKAEDISVIDVKDKTPFSDFVVIATAPNPKALEAYASDLEERFEKEGISVRKKEGTSESGWVIIDAGSVVVQLFTSEKRSLFGLDRLLGLEVKR